jgi:hypothetical protein
MALPHRQRGWLGLVVILLALVIVALSARTALKQYGLLDDPSKPHPAPIAKPGETELDRAAATTPRDALERARGVEDMVRKQAAEQEKRIDDAIPK